MCRKNCIFPKWFWLRRWCTPLWWLRCPSITASTTLTPMGVGGESVPSTVRFKCLQAAGRKPKSSQQYLTWWLLPSDPVDGAAWKRPPREDSCSNSGCYVQSGACRYLDYMLGFCSKHVNSHVRHFYTCVGISPEGLGNEMQLKNCLSPSAL